MTEFRRNTRRRKEQSEGGKAIKLRSKTKPETRDVAPAGYDNGSAGAFQGEAQDAIYRAAQHLDGGFWSEVDALWAAAHSTPDVTLRRIARAEAEIRRAKKALRAWADSARS